MDPCFNSLPSFIAVKEADDELYLYKWIRNPRKGS
jgi:hypothetical protein